MCDCAVQEMLALPLDKLDLILGAYLETNIRVWVYTIWMGREPRGPRLDKLNQVCAPSLAVFHGQYWYLAYE